MNKQVAKAWLLCTLALVMASCAQQQQQQLQESFSSVDFKRLKKEYDELYRSDRSTPNELKNIQNTAYVVYSNSLGKKVRLEDEDGKRMVEILAQVKYLPKKDYIKWATAEAIRESTNVYYTSAPVSHSYAFYSADDQLISSFPLHQLYIRKESQIQEYLRSESMVGLTYLPDALEQELSAIDGKYNQ